MPLFRTVGRDNGECRKRDTQQSQHGRIQNKKTEIRDPATTLARIRAPRPCRLSGRKENEDTGEDQEAESGLLDRHLGTVRP
jgi:hypothetical protein